MSAAHSITRCSVAHDRLIRARPRANRTFRLLVIPSLAPHPVGSNRQSPRHRYLRDLASSPYQQVDILTAPLWKTAHCDLGCFHQQEAQYRIPLFGDVAQSSPISRWTFPAGCVINCFASGHLSASCQESTASPGTQRRSAL
jgi:hypothetical protein